MRGHFIAPQPEREEEGWEVGTRAPVSGLMPKSELIPVSELKMECVGLNRNMTTWEGQPGIVPRALI